MNQTNYEARQPSLHGAIIGLGRMGLTHLAILNSHPLVEKLSVVESSTCFGKAVERNLGLTYYPSLEELFRQSVPRFSSRGYSDQFTSCDCDRRAGERHTYLRRKTAKHVGR